MNQFASYIARQEGKKHQASIGDIREIVKIITDLFRKELEYGAAIITINAEERFKDTYFFALALKLDYLSTTTKRKGTTLAKKKAVKKTTKSKTKK